MKYMPNIQDHLEEFTEILQKDLSIQCDKEGNWSKESTCQKITRILTLNRCNSDLLITIAKSFCRTLDTLERTPVIFSNDRKFIQPQLVQFSKYFEAHKIIASKLKQSPTPKIKQELNILQQRIIGLKYRIEALHGGIDKKECQDERLIEYSLALASRWKSKQELYPEQDKKLSQRDISKIRELSHYSEFTRILFRDKKLQDDFFKWTIRDNNNAAEFIEFPATAERLKTCLLDKRIGRLMPEELRIKKDKIPEKEIAQKIICLPFFNGHAVQHVSILDESKRVVLNGEQRSFTINEIFNNFARKKFTPGNLEFFSKIGITNWSNFEFGPWNTAKQSHLRIDFEKKEWWKQLPIVEEMTKEQIENKYRLKLNQGEWIRCISSTRETPDFDLLKRHGYIEMAIPQDNGLYAIYAFGKFPKTYASSKLSQLRLLSQTIEARIEYPDQNIFYSQRQRAAHPKVKTPEQGLQIMTRIKNDICKALEGNLTFQLAGENCAHWAEETIVCEEGKEAPNPFKMPVAKMHPSQPKLNYLVKSVPLLRLFASIDGKTIEENGVKVYKTTHFDEKPEEIKQYQPAHLNEQIEQGVLHGIISYGN